MTGDLLRYDGKVAIVTGAGRGMGFHHALLLAERGAAVLVNDINEVNAQTATKKIIDQGFKALAVPGDISKVEVCQNIVNTAIKEFGRVDILVNNAGIAKYQAFQDISPAEFTEMASVHLFGSWYMAQSVWPHMMKQGFGRIVLISSGSLWGMPHMAHYTTVKAGVMGLGINLGVEGKLHGIHVNAMDVIAGTEMTRGSMTDSPLKTFIMERLTPDCPANLMAYLVHDSCQATGQFLTAGGKGFGRFFGAGIPGWWSDEKLTPELVRDNFSALYDYSDYRVLESAQTVADLVAVRHNLTSMGELDKSAHPELSEEPNGKQ